VPRVRRFAMVTPNFYPRVCGVGDFSARFGSELLRRGHEVAVFSRAPVERNPQAPELEAHGVDGRLPTLIARNIAGALRGFAPTDVLLQYTSQMWDTWRFGSPATLGLALEARRAGARVTVFVHELYVQFYRRPDLFVGSALQRLQLGALLALTDRVFVTTGTRVAQIAGACRLVGARAPGIVRVGANALPVARRRPRDATAPRLGIFSTAGPGKRFDVVLEAFAQVAREVPGAELVLIGDLGPRDRPLVRQLLEDVARHPAKERIRLTGGLPLDEVSREIADLDVYLFPMDVGANTRSGTLPAALGAGLPVVAMSGVETDPGLFVDGENIVLATGLSAPAFAEATLRLLRDPAAMARVAEGARRFYDEELSWARIVERFLADDADGRP
jgi:glycosyltransferase involved in cell wall biosynthesis